MIYLFILALIGFCGWFWTALAADRERRETLARHLEHQAAARSDVAALTEALVRASGQQLVMRKPKLEPAGPGWLDAKPFPLTGTKTE